MPPKPKFTQAEIVGAALDIVAAGGPQALTAKSLGSALGCSASPIFTVFNTMQEIQDLVRVAAMARFERFTGTASADMPVFKQFGMKMVLFGLREPKLYQLLFMQEHRDAASFDDVFGTLGTTAAACIDAIEQDYALTSGEARQLFEHVWIYTFGIGALCATGVCRFPEEQLSRMLSAEFQAVMLLVRSGGAEPA